MVKAPDVAELVKITEAYEELEKQDHLSCYLDETIHQLQCLLVQDPSPSSQKGALRIEGRGFG